MSMLHIDPKDIETKDLHQYLLGAVAPRPIAFVSTVDENGQENLAPYSFYNAFSSNPPMIVFSSNRKVADNTTKDTLHNVKTTKECVINVVNYNIVRQMAVAAIQFPSDVSEFTKTGLTPIASELVKPPRVEESPVQMECKVKEIITLGEHGGAGHLILCEVVKMHVAKYILDENSRINPHKIDLMGRMGRAYYVRASGENVFPIIQSILEMSIGFDKLPKDIQNSNLLTGNDLGQLAGMIDIPTAEISKIAAQKHNVSTANTNEWHQKIHDLIKEENKADALALAFLEK